MLLGLNFCLDFVAFTLTETKPITPAQAKMIDKNNGKLPFGAK